MFTQDPPKRPISVGARDGSTLLFHRGIPNPRNNELNLFHLPPPILSPSQPYSGRSLVPRGKPSLHVHAAKVPALSSWLVARHPAATLHHYGYKSISASRSLPETINTGCGRYSGGAPAPVDFSSDYSLFLIGESCFLAGSRLAGGERLRGAKREEGLLVGRRDPAHRHSTVSMITLRIKCCWVSLQRVVDLQSLWMDAFRTWTKSRTFTRMPTDKCQAEESRFHQSS